MIKKQVAEIFRIIVLISIFLMVLLEIYFHSNAIDIKIENEKTECYNNCNQSYQNIDKILLNRFSDINNQKGYKELLLASVAKTKAEQLEIELQKNAESETLTEKTQTSTYEATFYTAKCNGCTGVTSSGYNVTKTIFYKGYRIVAAPSNVKLYTKLKITLADGTAMDAIVLDRGGSIKKNRLDILVSSKKEAYKLGRQQVEVEVIQ